MLSGRKKNSHTRGLGPIGNEWEIYKNTKISKRKYTAVKVFINFCTSIHIHTYHM